MSGDAYDVFLSYSRADSAAAETLRALLKEAGLSAFLDCYGLPAGQPWQPWLEQQLKSCRALLVLVGAKAFGEWQHREIQLGLDRQASADKAGERFPVIPVLLPGLADDAIPVGSFLSLNTWVDLRRGLNDDPQALQRLVVGAQGQRKRVIRNDLQKTGAVLPWFYDADRASALPDSRRLGAKASKKAGENFYLESLVTH